MKIAIIGRGNVGSHLSHYFAGIWPMTTLFPSDVSAAELVQCDVVLVCIPDAAIAPWLASRKFGEDQVLVHCSGSTAIDAIPHAQAAVLYPLQTFTKGKELNYPAIPFYYETKGELAQSKMAELVSKLPNPTKPLDSPSRLKLHVSAVVGCNFSVAMLRIAEQQLNNMGLSRSDLQHLVQESVDKFFDLGGSKSQTGPAQRADISTINKHTNILKDQLDIQNIYSLISEWIMKNKDGEL
ncbi:MAG: putative short-subunit dehydrogenase-like oxidoreductase (DUF2520 family) [Sphingobacteriales bacterium]|jgi:predicted short-subunit dehydrogenase-like oxidoreductase (DUF2520 family)